MTKSLPAENASDWWSGGKKSALRSEKPSRTRNIGQNQCQASETKRHRCSSLDWHPGRMGQIEPGDNSRAMPPVISYSRHCTRQDLPPNLSLPPAVNGSTLQNAYIAPVCRCVPPKNKPLPAEIALCQPFLEEEIFLLKPRIFVALGRIACDTLRKVFLTQPDFHTMQNISFAFSHNGIFPIQNDRWLVTSYHPSRQNTQTGRLTANMFDETWRITKHLLNKR